MQMERELSKGQLVPLVFMQADVAASQTDVAIPVAEITDAVAAADYSNAAGGYVMPFDGEVIAITGRSSAARSAGSATAEAVVDGTGSGLTAVLNATNTQSVRNKQTRGSDRFSAGSVISAKITTSADWAPETADVAVVVWVLLSLDGI